MSRHRRIHQSGVYKATNTINGKFYIGSSVYIGNRWDQHLWEAQRAVPAYLCLLHKAIRKYGVENFIWEVIEECEPIKDVLLGREQHYIDTLHPEYNLLPKAGSRLGSKSSPETIAKLHLLRHTDEWKQQASIRASAFMNEPDVQAKYRELREGKTWDEIFGVERSRQIRAQLGASRKLSPVVCAGWNKGLKMPEAQKQKLAEAKVGYIPWNKGIHTGVEPWNKGMTMPAEHCEKLSAAHLGQSPWNKGQTMDDEYCRKASETAKANFNPDHQARMTEAARVANTGKSRPQEVCDKISESNLKSEARKAYVESIRGIARPEVGQKVSETLQTSEKAKAYHEGRIGKSRGNSNPSGRGGVIWDKARNKWQVRVQGKSYGRFERLEDAIVKVDEVLAMLQST